MTVFILDGIWGGHTRWEPLRSRLDATVGSTRIWHYDNSGRTSLEVLAASLADELTGLNGPFHLIGYSMGGLVIREAMRQQRSLPLQKAAFIHSPHAGSLTAHLFPLPACREMRPGSAFLKRLEEAPWNYPTLATWCPSDAVVFPGHSACWAKASLVFRSDVPAHAWPVISRGIHNRILDFLTKRE